MQELRTEIEIDATPERVWQVLTDFERYPEWNPFMVSVEGVAREGERLKSRIGSMTFRPVVLAVDAPRELRWRGRLLLPGVFDGAHRFQIEPLGAERVRFVQSERFEGLLALLMTLIGKSTRRGFEAMNAALKQRAEAV